MLEQRLDARAQILESGLLLKHVRQNMGEKYCSATRPCVEGLPAFGLQGGVDESNPYVAALLQQAFIRMVVDPLKYVVL